jgi:transposase-like protein
MKKSRTTFPLEETDREAITVIREYYGVHSDADAIRIALRELYRRIKREGGADYGQQAFHPPHE